MARCDVVQVQCDRCKRIELRKPQPPKEEPDFELHFLGESVIFNDLDEPCREALKRLVERIKTFEREAKARLGPTVSGNEAPPLSPAPNYKPANPHAAGKS